MNCKILEITIGQFHKCLIEGKITVRQLVEYYLKRIKTYDQNAPSLNSIILVNPCALEEADNLDKKIKHSGLIGALYGVPVILKDNIDIVNMATTAGSLSLKGFIPEQNAFIVEKLRQAGAIIIAKSNLHEFALQGETISSILGQTLNPYDLTRTPGGSSGGTGAALAANFGLVGIGTDTINSIRSPSSANNLVGIRPTIGLVSRSGIVPHSLTQDTAGPIARTVEDAVAVLDVIAGYDSNDSKTAWCVDQKPFNYMEYLNKDGLKGKKIGVLESFFGKEEINQEVNMVMQQSIDILKENGSYIIPIKDEINSEWLTSDASVHSQDFSKHLNRYLNVLPQHAPVHSISEIIESGKYYPGIEKILKNAVANGVETSEYNNRIILQAQTKTRVMKIMAEYNLDAIIYPHQKQLVCKVGEAQQQRNGILCSVTGFPSIVVPAGFSTPTKEAPLGVPVGMEILGRPWSEPILIEIAYAFQEISKHREPPISTPELY